MLSRTAIAQYERDGYCFPLDILTPAEAAWLPRARLPKEAGYAEGLLRLGAAHLPPNPRH